MINSLWLTAAKSIFGWAAGLIVLTGVLVNFVPIETRGRLESEFGLGLLYELRGPRQPPDNIVIVGVDQSSAAALNAPDDPKLWSRRLHANLIRNAHRLGAELLVFNIFLEAPTEDSGADRELAAAIRDTGNVILIDYVKPRTLYSGVYVEQVVEPSPGFAGSALGLAPFLLPMPMNATRANSFLTFFDSDEKRATLPTLTFFLHLARSFGVEPVHAARGDLSASDPQSLPVPETPRLDLTGLAAKLLDGQASPLQLEPSLLGYLAKPAPTEHAEAHRRSLARILQSESLRYFNHYGPARSFPIVPYHDVAQDPPSAPAAFLKDKIVLVGFMEDFQPGSTEGLFYTPFSSLSSVELAATAIANLMEDRWVHPVFSPLGEALWLVLWGLTLGFCAQRLAFGRGMGLIVALGSGYLFVAWLTFANHGAWLPIMVPLGWQMPLAMITSISLNYRRQTRRGETMKSVMDRFIPSDVFHHLTGQEDQGTLPNYGRNATGVCLATDAGRYTALAEVMEPMALAQLMNDYYAAIFEPVTRHGGWISDVIGDAMLAVWIVEHDSGKARHQALAAAQEIREAVRRFEKQHGLVFPIRMGLHYGELRFGYVGTADRGEIRAVGDTVNTATRLEGLNKLLGSQILVSSQLLENLEFDRVRPVGEFLLPGKARPVSVAELLADNETAACPPELLARFREALTLFDESQWSEAYSAFTLLNLQFPEDGPTRFYQKTAGLYLTNPPDSQANPAILVEKSDPPRLSAQP